jgi:hypothetical protein
MKSLPEHPNNRPPILISVNFHEGRDGWQARHRHHIASNGNYKSCSNARLDFSNRKNKLFRYPFYFRACHLSPVINQETGTEVPKVKK